MNKARWSFTEGTGPLIKSKLTLTLGNSAINLPLTALQASEIKTLFDKK